MRRARDTGPVALQHYWVLGDGVGKLVERALRATGGDPDTAAELVPRFLALYEPVATRRTRPFPGVADTLQSLAAELALAVVTNKPEGAARKILADLGLAPSVAAVVGGEHFHRICNCGHRWAEQCREAPPPAPRTI